MVKGGSVANTVCNGWSYISSLVHSIYHRQVLQAPSVPITVVVRLGSWHMGKVVSVCLGPILSLIHSVMVA